jgi:hypothetical protein
MHHRIELGTYSSETGLQLPNWVPGYCLRVDAAGDEVTISANAQGLRSLAQHLLTLADDGVPLGVHVHLEPGLELDDDSVALIVDKRST